ncbi:hypothetical protein IJG20_01485 [Candidatus Saccharibacteria bacterium]|nr:hypothetical protein [Candidatus Saccharibacteria bacterium]
MKYLAILGRLEKISLAELEAQFSDVERKKAGLATFLSTEKPDIKRFGGVLKFCEEIPGGFNELVEFLTEMPEGKITLGVSNFKRGANLRKTRVEAMKLKRILSKNGRSVRVLENKEVILSTATSHHNQLAEKKNHVEIVLTDFGNYSLIGVQNITEYAKRDQARPARDAKVGMLPPKLAQILINLCGPLEKNARVLDPFCGTGVVLQEALLHGFVPYGTDLNPRMVEYSLRNLKWFGSEVTKKTFRGVSGELIEKATVEKGDATNFKWNGKIDAVATEIFLGQPMSKPPVQIKLKEEKQRCGAILVGFLKNLSGQISSGAPVVVAVPAWLRENGEYSRLNLVDEIRELGYNVVSFRNSSQGDLLYFREGQIVAREIIVLRKK